MKVMQRFEVGQENLLQKGRVTVVFIDGCKDKDAKVFEMADTGRIAIMYDCSKASNLALQAINRIAYYLQ